MTLVFTSKNVFFFITMISSSFISSLLLHHLTPLLHFFVAAAVLFLFAKYNPIFLLPYIHLHIFFLFACCWWCRWIKIRIVNKAYDLFICKILYIFTSPHRFMTELVCNFFSCFHFEFYWNDDFWMSVGNREKKKSTAITSTS